MTKKHLFLSPLTRFGASLFLIAVLLAACSAGTSTVAPVEPAAAQPSATVPVSVPTVATAVPTETLPATAIPVATSRGPELHATDPATVNLASGGLQLVEFFRFT